jgi:hypothetical protein
MDWQVIGGGIAAFLVGIGTVLVKWKPWSSGAKADAAANEAEAAMYKRLRDDIEALQTDVRKLRTDLDTERAHSRQLESYIWTLQSLMRSGGMDPPPMPAYPAVQR